MKSIKQYQLTGEKEQTITMPYGAVPLSVSNCGDCLWALVDEEQPVTKTTVRRVPREYHVGELEALEYIGTVEQDIGEYHPVWHVFVVNDGQLGGRFSQRAMYHTNITHQDIEQVVARAILP